MTPSESVPPRPERRGWAIWGARKPLLAYIAAVNLLAAMWSAVALAHLDLTTQSVSRFLILTALAFLFEEGSRKAARLRSRLSTELHRDMLSVWSVPAILVLPAGLTVVLVCTLYTYLWFRQQRPAGEQLYRKVVSVSMVVIACLAANAVATPGLDSAHGSTLAVAMAVVLAVAVETAVNRGLVTGALLIMGLRGRVLVGPADENLVEIASVCLGSLATLAVVYQPWLTPLVLAPMVSLQRGALVRQLELAASTDGKTGLLNAIAWEHVARQELVRAQGDASAVAVLIIDIDWFKLVNDRYGHLVGDEVLRCVGQRLTAELRGYDTVGRFGGEEFVAVLPQTSTAEALAVAERIRARINLTRVCDLVSSVPESVDADLLAVSIGVAVSPTDGAELTDLLYAADSALYAAKANGRNQVQLARRGGGPVRDTVSA